MTGELSRYHSTAHQVRVAVDAGQRTPLRRIWRYFGYDEPNYTDTPNGRALLGKLGALADGPFYVRAHFLLCSGDGTGRPKWGSTNAYTEDASGQAVYSWEILDSIFDAWLAAGCVPFVELGFMPEALSTAPSGTQYDHVYEGGWRYPPRDYSRWQGLVEALARHCLDRYGQREVSRWYWELWNEPDIFYWAGTLEEYCRLYDYTVAGLTAALPWARVGGPATTSPARPAAGDFLRRFLAHCVGGENAATGERGTRLDFVSFHTKGGGYRHQPDAPKATPTIHTLVRHAAAGLDIVGEFPELARAEVVLSECDPDGWAAGSIRDNPNLAYRNTEYYASYVAESVCKLIDLGSPGSSGAWPRIDGMLTWAFQFEGREYFAGLRSLSTNGVDKPVLSVFRMLARLGGARLALTSDAARAPLEGGDRPETPPDVSGLATLDGEGGVRVLLVSHHDDWDVRRPSEVRLSVRGLTDGRYSVRRYLLDAEHGSSHAAWLALGSPQQPTPQQLAELHRASRLALVETASVEATGREATLEMALAPHAVCLIELSAE